MSTIRRPTSRRQGAQRRRQSFLKSQPTRQPPTRQLGAERLEARTMLAADMPSIYVSDFWNYRNPNDVNNDSQVTSLDLLAIINSMTAGGARKLSGTTFDLQTGFAAHSSQRGPTAAEGESPTTPAEKTYYIDANNDGVLNALDLLSVINDITGEGEGHDPALVRLKLVPVLVGTVTPLPQDANGNYIIREGDYYELRALAQDTGVLDVGGQTGTRLGALDADRDGVKLPETALGLVAVHMDLSFDTSQTAIQVTETQVVEITGSPTSPELDPDNPTRFRLTFNGQTTAPITYSGDPVLMSRNIRDALVALPNVGRTAISNLRNVEVGPVDGKIVIRFINDLADQNVTNMTGALTNAAGATGIAVQTTVQGDPTNINSFDEMFRGRTVRDQNSAKLAILNEPMFFDTNQESPLLNGERTPTGVNDGGSFTEVFAPEARSGARKMDEVQVINISESARGGTFRISYGGQTTSAIPFQGTDDTNDGPVTGANIQAALRALPNAGDSVVVLSQSAHVFTVTFSGVDGGIDQPLMSMLPANNNLTPGGQTVTFTEAIKGVNSPDNGLVEVFRLPMKALEKVGTGPLTIVGSVDDLDLGNFFVALYGVDGPVPANRMTFDPFPTILITEAVSAGADSATINEGSGATTLIPVLANDTDSTAGPQALSIFSFTQPAAGTGTVSQVGGQLRYTVPNGNFEGTVSFTYTVTDNTGTPRNTDTATVTVTVKATNDPPVNSVPGAQTVDEDSLTGRVFSAGTGNAITISDSDAANASIRVTLAATNGTLAMGSIANLAVTGDGSGSVVVVGSTSNINLGLSGLRFTPNANYNGAAQITVTTNDLGNTAHADNPSQGTDVDVIPITVVATNDAPVNTVPGAQTVDEAVTLTFNVANGNVISVSDIDADAGTPPSVTVTISTSQGGLINANLAGGATVAGQGSTSVTISGTMTQVNATLAGLTYRNNTPSADVLTVTTSDNGNTGLGGVKTDIDSVAITVLATTRPRAINDAFDEDEGLAFADLDVLLNDLSNAGETRRIDSITLPAGFQGTLVERPADGTIPREHLRYTPPDANFFGTVTFSYTMSETDLVPPGGTQLPNSGPTTTTVTLVIGNVNDAPVGVADGFSTNEDVVLTVAATGVLANDTDPDNRAGQPAVDTLTAQLVAQPPASQGAVSLNANGSFSFTPAANFNGSTSFTYRVSDGVLVSADTTVTITVNAQNDAPVGNADSFGATEDQVLTVPAAGVLANDTDVDNPGNTNAGLTATISQQPPAGQGTVALAADGSFTWTPPAGADFAGSTSFRYKAADGTGLQSAETTVTINVAPLNDAPVAANADYLAVENRTLTVDVASGLLKGTSPFVTDVDTSRTNLTASVVTPPAQGTLTLNPNGSFSYTPPTEFNGDVTFEYRASDGALFSNTATVTITVAEVNDPPTAVNNTLQAFEDTPLVLAAPGILANDTDPENNPLSVSFVSPLSGPGTLTANADGSLTYMPPANQSGNAFASFTYRVTDGPNQSNTATVTINVQEVNDNPIANNDTFTAIKDFTDQTINVRANDTIGPDVGETLTVVAVNGNANSATTASGGTVRLVGGQVKYDSPPAGFTGTDSFTYTISDGRGGAATATVNITVLDFVPKTVSGTVYLDADNDGNVDGGEKRLAGVEILLSGSGLLGQVSLSTRTDINGDYSFAGVAPGSYTVSQVQPRYMRDGIDSEAASLATLSANNAFSMSWLPTDFSGNISGLNFGERGIDAASMDDASGLLGEILSSSGSNGFILATDMSGNTAWSYNLPGWANMKSVRIVLDAGLEFATLLVTDSSNVVHTRKIFQDPSGNTGTGSPLTPPGGSMARFRILCTDGNGDKIIRLDGLATDFGMSLAAASVPEGEGEAPLSDGQFRAAADALFAAEAWA